MTRFEARVRRVVSALREGEVATYGEIAEEAGFPGAARAVGGVLSRSDGLPWWRVVTSSGRLVPGLEAEHARRLAAEGLRATGGRLQWPEISPRRSRSMGSRRGPVIRSPEVRGAT